MPESKFLNYAGLQTYTNYVKNYVNSKEELLFPTFSNNTLTATTIDAQIYHGKKVVIWVNQSISSSQGKSLTLNFSGGGSKNSRIYFRPGKQLTNEYDSGPIKLIYLENVSFGSVSYSGWFCDADIYDKVTDTMTNSKYYLTGSTSSTPTTGGLVKRSTIYVDTDGHLYDNGYQIPSEPIDPILILANLEW